MEGKKGLSAQPGDGALPFDPYRSPAELSGAETHRRATGVTRAEERSFPPCPCCAVKPRGDPLSWFDSLQTFARASPALGLVPRTWALLGLFLLGAFLASGLPMLLRAPHLARSLYLTASQETELKLFLARSPHLQLAALCSLLVMLGLRVLCRRAWTEERSPSLADRALLVDVPGAGSEAQIQTELKEWLRTQGRECSVVSLTKIYCIGNCLEALRRLALARKACCRAQALGRTPLSQRALTEKAAVSKVAAEHQLVILNANPVFSGKVLAVFASAAQRREAEQSILPRWPFCTRLIFRASPAGQPGDYLWENFRPKAVGPERFLRAQQGWVRLAPVVIFTFALVFCFSRLLAVNLRPQLTLAHRRWAMLCCNAVIIATATRVLGMFVRQDSLQHAMLFSAAKVKSFLMTFTVQIVTAAGSILLTSAIVYRQRKTPCFWRERGVAPAINAILVLELLLALLGPALNLRNLLRFCRRWRYRRVLVAEGPENSELQCDINEAFEKEGYDVWGEHAQVFYVTGLALFFQSVAPYAAAMSLLIVLARLCWQRWKAIHLALRLRESGESLLNASLVAINACLFLWAAGGFCFGLALTGIVPWLSVAGAAALVIVIATESCKAAPALTEGTLSAEPTEAYRQASPGRWAEDIKIEARLGFLRRTLADYALQRYGWGCADGNIYRNDLADQLQGDEESGRNSGTFNFAPNHQPLQELSFSSSQLFGQRRSDQDLLPPQRLGTLDSRRNSSPTPLEERDSGLFTSTESIGTSRPTAQFGQGQRILPYASRSE